MGNVDGVIMRRRGIDAEVQRLVGITKRLGLRLSYWQRICGVHELPPKQWTDNYTAYAQAVLRLLGEQRERAKLTAKSGAEPMSDEEYARAVTKLAEEIVRGLTEDEFRRLSALRAADQRAIAIAVQSEVTK